MEFTVYNIEFFYRLSPLHRVGAALQGQLSRIVDQRSPAVNPVSSSVR
jgi:hypothetical protein